MSTIMHEWAAGTLEYNGQRPAQVVGGKEMLISSFATPTAPGRAKKGFTQVWRTKSSGKYMYGHLDLAIAASGDDGDWLYIEDHRQVIDDKGTKSGGTGYWLSGEDDYTSPERYAEALGPLPGNATMKRPKKPDTLLLEEAYAAKRAAIIDGYEAALAGSVALADPSPTSVAIESSLLAVMDPEGLEYVRDICTARRDALLAMLAAALTVDAVHSIEVAYAI